MFNLNILIAIFFSLQIEKLNAMSCFSCASRSASVCNITQKETPCADANSVCLTITFKEKWGTKEIRNYFEKKCVSSNYDCQQNCANLKTSFDCKPSCCDSSLCNEEVDERVIWYGLIKSDAATSNGSLSYVVFLLLFTQLISQLL